MKGWLLLSVAIVAEVIATSALKASDGFSRLGPSLVVVAGYGQVTGEAIEKAAAGFDPDKVAGVVFNTLY